MKVGLFFGSFNPIHLGHLIIANHIANFHTDAIWFIVSPQNPFKKIEDLLDFRQRFLMVESAVVDDDRFKASDVEFKMPKPSYTINTLDFLSKKYPDYNFSLIIGSDNLISLSSWKNAESIINNHQILVYERPDFKIDKESRHNNIMTLNAGLLDISSTFIRNLIAENKNVRYLLPESVREIIEQKGFYK